MADRDYCGKKPGVGITGCSALPTRESCDCHPHTIRAFSLSFATIIPQDLSQCVSRLLNRSLLLAHLCFHALFGNEYSKSCNQYIIANQRSSIFFSYNASRVDLTLLSDPIDPRACIALCKFQTAISWLSKAFERYCRVQDQTALEMAKFSAETVNGGGVVDFRKVKG
jgi:hypothetical protein